MSKNTSKPSNTQISAPIVETPATEVIPAEALTLSTPILKALRRIQEIQKATPDVAAKKIKAMLTIEDFDDKTIAAAAKEAGLSNRSGGEITQPQIITWFGEAPRTERELFQKVLDEATKNECRWINDRNQTRLMTLKIYAKFGAEFKEEVAPEALKKAVKARADAK